MQGNASSPSSSPSPSAESSGKIPFTLVVPAYNEERRLPTSIRDIRSFFGNYKGAFEVLVMVEKSKDRTVELGRAAAEGESRIEIVDNEVQRGKGYAVRCGMLRAKGDIVFFMDADLSTPLSEVLKFLQHFNENPDTGVAIGSRAHSDSQILKKQSWFRRNLGRTFNKFVMIFGVKGVKDTQCGFKAFRRKAAQEIFKRQTINGFAFDVEVLLLARRLGFHIEVLPVKWVNSPDSKVRILIDPLKMLWDLIRIRLIVRRTLRAQPPAP